MFVRQTLPTIPKDNIVDTDEYLECDGYARPPEALLAPYIMDSAATSATTRLCMVLAEKGWGFIELPGRAAFELSNHGGHMSL